ncbi:MAG: fatty acid desaturase [Planctomycetota bacterium]
MANFLTRITQWVDTQAGEDSDDNRIDWLRVIPFLILHLGCLGVIWVGWSWTAVGVALALYAIRMFAITAFYHRYFSHRSFKTNRFWQFVFALIGGTASQRGALWWAAHHRHHHRHSDTEHDPHSPHEHGVMWSHVWWFMTPRNFKTDYRSIKDFSRYPELRFLDRFDTLIPTFLAIALFLVGGWQMLVWGFFISTVVLFHCTCLINSAAHIFGSRRYETRDTSKNSLLLALVTFGEGWHNNHHHYPSAVRQGHRWWEIDLTWYGLMLMEKMRIVQGLRPVPERILQQGA